MSAFSYYHKIRQQTDSTNTFFIKKLLNGIKNKSVRVLGLKPSSKNILRKMIDFLPFTCETRFDQVLFEALMLLLVYYRCSKVGEAILSDHEATHTLTANAVRQSYAIGQIKAFKHSNSRNCILKLQRSLPDSYCPVLA